MAKIVKSVNNLVIVSDTHINCQLGLCGPKPIRLDEGGTYRASPLQRKVYRMWREFWDVWVPKACHGEPFAVVLNGDATEGIGHHGSTHQISHNAKDQFGMALGLLRPVVKLCPGRFYMTRGTEAHVGPSSVEDERLAQALGAVPDKQGRHARYHLRIRIGRGLVDVMHHIGTTSTSSYESTALMKELAEAYTEAARWGRKPPNVVVRSHRHRHLEVRVSTTNTGIHARHSKKPGYGIVFTTAGWQLKTPFVFRTGSRQTVPQIGGSLIRQGDVDLYSRHWVQSMEPPRIEVPT